MKRIILFSAIFILFACASNQTNISAESLTRNSHDIMVKPLMLPNWFLNMPQEQDFAIGIAATNTFRPELTDSIIKENASVICNRNKSAIVIAKLKMKENQTLLTPILSEFKLQLANDIPELKRYYKNSQIVKRTEHFGMTIGLVAGDSLDILLDEAISISEKAPLWYKDNAYYTDDNYLNGCGTSSSVSMESAYNNAYKEAVYNLIAGIKPEVKSAIINSQNYIERFVEIDASLIIENMTNTRNSLVLRKSGNGFIYDGYVEIRWQPKYTVKEIKIKD